VSAAAVDGRRLRDWRRTLPPCLIVRAGDQPSVPVHVRDGAPAEVWVELEDGGLRRDLVPGGTRTEMVDGRPTAEVAYRLPDDLPLGWHRLRLGEQEVAQAQERFRAGVAGNADVITASLNLNAARTQYIDALTALQAARVALARAEGLVTTLH
jgi:hypothetical protein